MSMPSATIGEATDASANTQIAAPVPRSGAVRFMHCPSSQNTGFSCLNVENRSRAETRRRICSADCVPTVVRPDAILEP
jgi:hypothetical protein